ncbi:Ubiquitin-conjugating enzyme [Orobanche gracilis]
MKSPTQGSRYVTRRSSKKRFFHGGSSSPGFEEVGISETAPSGKIILQPVPSKKKKSYSVMAVAASIAVSGSRWSGQSDTIQTVAATKRGMKGSMCLAFITSSISKILKVICVKIDLDIEDSMVIDKVAETHGKGKEITSEFSADVSNLSNDGPPNHVKTPKQTSDVDDRNSSFFSGEDECVATHHGNIAFNGHTDSGSQFDHMDLSPGGEVPCPLFPDCLKNSTNSTSTSSSLKIESNSKKEKLGTVLLEAGCGSKRSDRLQASGKEPLLSLGENKRKYSAALHVGCSSPSTLKEGPGEGGGVIHASQDLTEPSGLMIGNASIGRGAEDSAYNQNRGSPGNVDQSLDEVSVKIELFKKFETVEDCSDHHYVKKGYSNQVKPPKNWAKRIQEEWKILENSLPDAIFVRVYESRMDLLRAVIVGAEGTPYHNGLFFFDVLLADDYPNSPPELYYHSSGLRINPNLYDSGKVCLSLLKTWHRKSPEEDWMPGSSTMLQVLVSIQGLILNAKPYFNEPGYERSYGTPSGEQHSLRYNEKTFIYSLQTMVYTMRKPPKHFEELVVDHFCKHARDILVSCKAYSEGAQVGSLVSGVVQDVVEGDKSRCSDDFKSELAGFITTLIDALSQIGAKDCQEFLSLAQKASGKVITAPRAVK